MRLLYKTRKVFKKKKERKEKMWLQVKTSTYCRVSLCRKQKVGEKKKKKKKKERWKRVGGEVD